MLKKKLWTMFIVMTMIATTACSSRGSGEEESQEKPVKADGKTVITLTIQQPDGFYQTVEKKFEEKYPDIDLQIISYKKNAGEEWAAGDIEKHQKTTNAALLSGKGADIIEVGGLPLKEYINKKLVLNMKDLWEKDNILNKNDLQKNVLEATKKANGGLYAMPYGFYLTAFVGDGDILANASVKMDDKSWDWKEFGEQSRTMKQQAGKNRFALAGTPPERILYETVFDRFSQFVDSGAKTSNFDSPEFVETMQQIKKLYDEKVMTANQAEEGKQLFHNAHFYSMADLIEIPHQLFLNPKLLQKPHAKGQNGVAITPSFEFAISAKSLVKEEAWKFVTFLLSEDVQSLQDGFSLQKSVNEKKLNDIKEQMKNGTFKLTNGKAIKVPNEEFAQIQQIIDAADHYENYDPKIVPMIEEEAKPFFNGQKSAEKAAKLIQNRVTTYLNE
ncbi:ABC transporter substrate-binding protein [Paenibacillus ginsengarvi]|uniref:Extracellular solute-binding protein n=1 Tax=Paenibacillus ginsengarvi TaxID=400777 RepID=A0A3B0AQF9_9BACL|nr:extracellular solute-binding protein [Paenibacillus ginsengarvi]RKN63005.1 extracellular solute-binding protein [Paenibacillus ginsengarvi]